MKVHTLAATGFLAMLLAPSALAAQSQFARAGFNENASGKGYVVQGIELRKALPGIVNDSVGYTAVLHTQVGANACEARTKEFSVVSENDYSAETTDLLVVDRVAENIACREIYQPVFADLEGYVATEKGYAIRIDTNSAELGVVELLGGKKGAGRSDAVITEFAPRAVRDLGPGSDWVSLDVETTVLKGSNPCIAGNTRLTGFGYTVESRLYVVVKSETIDPTRVCTMEFNPVYESLAFGAVYRPGSVKEIVVKNKGELGIDAVQALPSWAP